jgi:hypothetical protein
MYVKTTNLSHKTTQEEFNKLLEEKIESTKKLLNVFKGTEDDNKWELAKSYQTIAKMCHYRENYVAVSRIENSKGQVVKLQPTFNQLVLITEQRAFELQQSDYADRFSVFSSVQSESMDSIEDEVEQKVEEFNGIKAVRDRLKFMIEYSKTASKENLGNFLELIPGKYKDYYDIVGPDIITACSYVESEIKKKWRDTLSNSNIEDEVVSEIYHTFRVGQRYTKSGIKDALNGLYEKMGYKKKAKATDLEIYYLMKYVKFQDSSGKWVNGFELIGKR